MRSGEFYSKGKFLLSGEYYVLYGAKALAVPLKFGQKMQVREIPGPGLIEWETYIQDKLWFSAGFNRKDMSILYSSNGQTALFIQDILRKGGKLQPDLFQATKGYFIQNYIDFDLTWGLGSSSSLISNMAYWLDVDPYALYCSIFSGSGYDIFCARANGPIIYQLLANQPEVREIKFKPSFIDNLYFIYLGSKQDSQESVKKFRKQQCNDEHIVREISVLTDKMLSAATLADFLKLMRLHEEILSNCLGLPMVKEELFPDFQGEIKSLGAWGGDFVLAGTSLSYKEVRDYFTKKNLPVIFRWQQIIFES